jgi:hypothetical protein
MSTTLQPSEMSTTATLEIHLPVNVAAQELQALLAIAQFIYSSTEWLELAEQQQFGVPMPDEDYVPVADARLKIAHLEIGTPNKLTLSGRIKGITAIAALLTTLIGVPTAGALAYKTYEEGQRTRAETAKILEETELLKIQRRNAERLEREGRISDESLRSKNTAPDVLARYYSFAAPLLIKQKFTIRKQN